MPWDSQVLSLRVGRSKGCVLPGKQELDAFDLVLARLPLNADEQLMAHQNAGFQFIAIDLDIAADTLKIEALTGAASKCRLIWVERQNPSFEVRGFHVGDSRLERDLRCQQRLPDKFWDSLIIEHCRGYADLVLCALDTSKQQLIGVISCFLRGDALELFLVAVHPGFRGAGIGSELLRVAGARARAKGLVLTSQVLATNVNAINFYVKSGFRVTGGEIVLHRWKETNSK